jgi:hypothetical protein
MVLYKFVEQFDMAGWAKNSKERTKNEYVTEIEKW